MPEALDLARVTIRIPHDVREWLAARAREEVVSQNALIVRALRELKARAHKSGGCASEAVQD